MGFGAFLRTNVHKIGMKNARVKILEKYWEIALRGSPENVYIEYVLLKSANSYVKALPKISPGKRRPRM